MDVKDSWTFMETKRLKVRYFVVVVLVVVLVCCFGCLFWFVVVVVLVAAISMRCSKLNDVGVCILLS